MNNSLFDDNAEEFAQSIDRSLSAGTYLRGRLFVEAASREVKPGSRVLDYGCGPGRIARLLAERGFDVLGMDPSRAMIDAAFRQDFGKRRPTFCVSSGNGEQLETAAYEAIVCACVIEYVPDADGLLRNFARALVPGGALIMSYTNRRSLWAAFVRHCYRPRPPHIDAQVNRWTPREAKAALERANFILVDGPIFLEASPFDKRTYLRSLSSYSLVGTIGFVVAHCFKKAVSIEKAPLAF